MSGPDESHGPSTRRRSWLNWFLLGAAFGVALFSGLAIISLGKRSDALRQMETAMARLQQRAHELNSFEWETLQKGTLKPEVEKAIAVSRREMEEQFKRLSGLGGRLPQVAEIAERFERYTKAVDQEFNLLGAGKIKEAHELDETDVDPAFDKLADSLGEASQAFDIMAGSSLKEVQVWTVVILLVAAGTVALLFWQFYQRRRASELADLEQTVLRRANDELEERVTARTAELAQLNKEIGATAREAGMAEVANNVLHNVGNALNSVNVSATLMRETLAQTRLTDLPAASGLLEEHSKDLGAFLTRDERGQQFPAFLRLLARQWEVEHQVMLKESASLSKHVQHIREIIQRQQAISGVSGVMESLSLEEILDDSVSLSAALLENSSIRIHHKVGAGAKVFADRSKLTQILVNLITNAAQALQGVTSDSKEIIVSSEAMHSGRRLIHVTDNGPGILPENLSKIFCYGFTTKKTGHGFGLHGSALAAVEMGGVLSVKSDGLGRGATFSLELPTKPGVQLDQAA